VAITSVVTALGVIAAAIGAWLAFSQLKETRRDRHMQVVSEFGRRWDDERILEARYAIQAYDRDELADLIAEWLVPPREDATKVVPVLLRLPNYFEDLAILVDVGRLEFEYVTKAFRNLATREWEHWEPAVQRMREKQPNVYIAWEALVRKLEKGGSSDPA
jgi:hypothetical protein